MQHHWRNPSPTLRTTHQSSNSHPCHHQPQRRRTRKTLRQTSPLTPPRNVQSHLISSFDRRQTPVRTNCIRPNNNPPRLLCASIALFAVKTKKMKILKLHSQGPEVAALQNFLHIQADGIFGPITFKHVRSWQSVHGLTSDGIVGPITFHAMAENGFIPHGSIVLEGLEIEEYFLPENAFFANPLVAERSRDKKWIFLHHTKGWHNPYRVIDSWGRQLHRKVATEYVIGGQSIHNDNTEYDGRILQAIPNNGYAWHLGIGNQSMHRESIGIELCSFGYLTKGYFEKRENGKLQSIERKKDSYYTYVGQKPTESKSPHSTIHFVVTITGTNTAPSKSKHSNPY